MRRAQCSWSAHNCVNWYSVDGRTDLPQGVPCLGSSLTGTPILLVYIPRGCCRSCSYCAYGFWSTSCSCFACDSYYICDSWYAPCCMPYSGCMPYPVPVAYLRCPWSSNIPVHGLCALHFGHVPRWGCLQGQPVEGSWPICAVPHQAWLDLRFLADRVLCHSKTVLTAKSLASAMLTGKQHTVGQPATLLYAPLTPGTLHLNQGQSCQSHNNTPPVPVVSGLWLA